MKDKPHIIHSVLILGLVITIVVLALNQNVNVVTTDGVSVEDKNTISVSDTGRVTVTPDIADLHIKVLTDAVTAESAQQNNADLMDSVIKALKREGVDEDDLETTNFRLSPKYDWDKGYTEIVGYTVTHNLKVTTNKIKEVGELADVAVGAGANGIDYINFRLSDDMQKQVKNQAIEKAADAAKAKAKTLASAAGVSLGDVIGVSESSSYYQPYRYYGFDAVAEGGAPKVDTEISPEDVDVTAQVTLTYELK